MLWLVMSYIRSICRSIHRSVHNISHISSSSSWQEIVMWQLAMSQLWYTLHCLTWQGVSESVTTVVCILNQVELNASHASYMAHHPDLRALLSDYMQQLLIEKPSDVLEFSIQYFSAFNYTDLSQHVPGVVSADHFYQTDVARSNMQMYNVQNMAPGMDTCVQKQSLPE